MYHVTHLLAHDEQQRRRRDPEAVAIRFADPADAAALADLAETDGAPLAAARLSRLATEPDNGAVLVAAVDGHPVAALDVEDGTAVADPFEPTAPVVALLRLRAHQLDGRRRHRPRLGRLRIHEGARPLRPAGN